jgi:hypothetical protein
MMANNYTQFSFLLPLPTDPEKAKLVPEWVKAQQEMTDVTQELDDNVEWYEWYRYLMEFDPNGVWIYTDETGSPEAAANIAQLYLSDFDIEGGVLITWADTCSKPRIGEFSGGAVVVTKDKQMWQNFGDLCREAAEAGVEILN